MSRKNILLCKKSCYQCRIHPLLIFSKSEGDFCDKELNCLENLRCTQEGLEFPSFKEYVAVERTALKGKIKQLYEDTHVDFKSWKNWFLSLEDIPDDLKEGVAQLRYFGILSDEFVDRFIKYHDDNRQFPREYLIPDDIYHYLKVKLAISIPDYLTINQARGYLEKKMLRWPVCNELFNNLKSHRLRRRRKYPLKKDYIQCPVCKCLVKSTKLASHWISKHSKQ